jgi:hypothetical protein
LVSNAVRNGFFWTASQGAASQERIDGQQHPVYLKYLPARVVEVVDARDLKSLDLYGRAGSSPALGTKKIKDLSIILTSPFLRETGSVRRDA